MPLSRRGFLGTILGSAAASLVVTPKWLWAPTVDAPPIPETALLTIDQILAAFGAEVDRELQAPKSAFWTQWNRGPLVWETLELPRVVPVTGPSLLTLQPSARRFAEIVRRAKQHRDRRPLDRLGNDLHEAHLQTAHSGVQLRAFVYPDQRAFGLSPDAKTFVLRFDMRG